jgi:hypothetical protein
MSRLAIPLALILALALLALAACDGDEDSDTPAPSFTVGITPEVSTSPTPTAPAASTPSTDAISISPPADNDAFIETLNDLEILKQLCVHDIAASTADCGDYGLYALSPAVPLREGETIECSVFLVDAAPIAVSCATASAAVVYEIPQ